MPAINIPVEERLMHEIRVRAALQGLTRREWIRRALEEAAEAAPEQKAEPQAVAQ